MNTHVSPTVYDIPDSRPAIKLGEEVRDLLTGVQGIAAICSILPSGNRMWAVQPTGEGKKPEEGVSTDENGLIIVGPGLRSLAVPIGKDPADLPYTFGDKVEDVLTGVIGRVKEINLYMNGCTYVSVAYQDQDGHPTSCNIEWMRVKKLSGANVLKRALDGLKAVVTCDKDAPVDAARPLRRPGGPSRAIDRSR